MYEAIRPDKKALQQEYMQALEMFAKPEVQDMLLQGGVKVRVDKLVEGFAKQFELLQSDEFLEQLDSRQMAAIQVQKLLMENKGQIPQSPQANVVPVPKSGSNEASPSGASNPSSEAQKM
jgi:hypothetical protein